MPDKKGQQCFIGGTFCIRHSDSYPDLLIFLFLPICSSSKLARIRRLHSSILQTNNSSFLAFKKIVTNPIGGH